MHYLRSENFNSLSINHISKSTNLHTDVSLSQHSLPRRNTSPKSLPSCSLRWATRSWPRTPSPPCCTTTGNCWKNTSRPGRSRPLSACWGATGSPGETQTAPMTPCDSRLRGKNRLIPSFLTARLLQQFVHKVLWKTLIFTKGKLVRWCRTCVFELLSTLSPPLPTPNISQIPGLSLWSVRVQQDGHPRHAGAHLQIYAQSLKRRHPHPDQVSHLCAVHISKLSLYKASFACSNFLFKHAWTRAADALRMPAHPPWGCTLLGALRSRSAAGAGVFWMSVWASSYVQ